MLSIDFLIINATCLSLRKYHPEPTVRSAPPAQMPAGPTSVARQPPTMAPWAQAAKAAPTPAPWAQTPRPPSPWNTEALVSVAPAPAPAPAVQWLANQADDPWGTYEVPNQVRIQLQLLASELSANHVSNFVIVLLFSIQLMIFDACLMRKHLDAVACSLQGVLAGERVPTHFAFAPTCHL